MWDVIVHWSNDLASCASGDPGLLKWAGVVSDPGSSGQEEEEAER